MKRQPKGVSRGGQFARDTRGKTPPVVLPVPTLPQSVSHNVNAPMVYPVVKGSNPVRRREVQVRAYESAGVTRVEAEARIDALTGLVSAYKEILTGLPVGDLQRLKVESLARLAKDGGVHKFPVLIAEDGTFVPAIHVVTPEGKFWACWETMQDALKPRVPAAFIIPADRPSLMVRRYTEGYQVRVAAVSMDPYTDMPMFLPDDLRSKPRPLPNSDAPTFIRKSRP